MSENKDNIKNPLICRPSGEILMSDGKTLPAKEYISDTVCRELIKEAMEAMKFSYSPYTDFKVGSALLTKARKIYTGCNIENAVLSPSICAERVAFSKAISDGNKTFKAIAIVGGKDGVIEDYCPPCGVCRQFMVEFCQPESFVVILARSEADYWIYPLADLMPLNFSPNNLSKE